MNKEQLQEWVTPKLTVYGSISEITKDPIIKQFGASDGFTFQGTPIGDVQS